MTGPQVQLRSGLFVCVEVLRPSQQLMSCRVGQLPIKTVPGQAGPPSSFAGLNYYLFCVKHKNSVGLEAQLQQKSTGLAKTSLVEDQRISG